MLKEEQLQRTDRREYEEPGGEFLEVIERGSNTITVLTRVADSEKGGGEAPSEDLPDPSEYSVSDLEAELEEKVRTEGLSEEQRRALLAAESEDKNRKTAKTAIKDA